MLDEMITATDIILNLYLYLAGFLVILMMLDCAVKVYGLFTYSFPCESLTLFMSTPLDEMRNPPPQPLDTISALAFCPVSSQS